MRVASRRGKVITRARVTPRTNEGMVYMTYQWWIGACNELTLHKVDPTSKTPEYKFCAVRLEPIADQVAAEVEVSTRYAGLKRALAEAATAEPAREAVPA